MKSLKHLFAVFMLLCTTTVMAHNFEVDGIYYNILYSDDKTVEVTYRGGSYDDYDNEYTGSVTIPSTVTYNGTSYSVTSIGEGAFEGCSSLTSIEIPNSVTSIGFDAFYDCSGLTSVEIPNSVTSIGRLAFYGCDGLASITVVSGNTKYDSRGNCNAIIETETNSLIFGCNNTIIPNSVTSIGDFAFYGRDGFTSVVIPGSVTSIGEGAFSRCSGLTSVVIPNSVTSIGDGAFNGCSGLTSIEIPNSVTSIGSWAFSRCSGLTSIEIPNSVTSIGDGAFEDCSGLTSIKSYLSSENLFVPGEYTFYGIDKDICILYVPEGSRDTYASTIGWSDFNNIIEFDVTGIDEVKEQTIENVIYNLQGNCLVDSENLEKGVYIVNGKKVLVK